MPLSLLNHSALALFAQRTRIPTSARSIGFCAIWVCISSSSSSQEERAFVVLQRHKRDQPLLVVSCQPPAAQPPAPAYTNPSVRWKIKGTGYCGTGLYSDTETETETKNEVPDKFLRFRKVKIPLDLVCAALLFFSTC